MQATAELKPTYLPCHEYSVTIALLLCRDEGERVLAEADRDYVLFQMSADVQELADGYTLTVETLRTLARIEEMEAAYWHSSPRNPALRKRVDKCVHAMRGRVEMLAAQSATGPQMPRKFRDGWSGIVDSWDEQRYQAARDAGVL